MKSLQPLVQGDMRPLHDRFHGDGEILAAHLFSTPEYAMAFGGVGMADHAAMRADRAGRP